MKKIIYSVMFIFLIGNVNANEVLLQTQQDVDYYGQAGYSWFPGSVRINTYAGQDSSTMITDLSPLLVFDSIAGGLTIQNTILTNLHGLENLKVGYNIHVYENAELVDATALSLSGKFTSLEFRYNPKLKVLPSTENFLKLGPIVIENNPQLEGVDLILKGSASSISIRENNNLENISIHDDSSWKMRFDIGFNNSLQRILIKTESDSIFRETITDNPKLEFIEGYGKVHRIDFVRIERNSSLNKLCHLQNVLNRQGVFFMTLNSNGSHANSEADILATDCSDFNTSVAEVSNVNLNIYPNPAKNEVFVKDIIQPTLYVIYDMSGKQITQGTVTLSGRIGLELVISGMYILKIGNQHSKLLVE